MHHASPYILRPSLPEVDACLRHGQRCPVLTVLQIHVIVSLCLAYWSMECGSLHVHSKDVAVEVAL